MSVHVYVLQFYCFKCLIGLKSWIFVPTGKFFRKCCACVTNIRCWRNFTIRPDNPAQNHHNQTLFSVHIWIGSNSRLPIQANVAPGITYFSRHHSLRPHGMRVYMYFECNACPRKCSRCVCMFVCGIRNFVWFSGGDIALYALCKWMCSDCVRLAFGSRKWPGKYTAEY